MLDGTRVPDVVDPLDARGDTAETEEQQGNDEAPEIELSSISERVLGVRTTSGAPHSVQQQCFIAGINETVDRLRQHRRRAGRQSSRQLRDRDEQVAYDRSPDGRARAGSCHLSLYCYG